MKAFLALLLLLAGIPLAYGQTPNVSTALFYNNFGSLNVSWQGNSPSIVTITPGSGSITDSLGNTWTLNGSNQPLENGSIPSGSFITASQLVYANQKVWANVIPGPGDWRWWSPSGPTWNGGNNGVDPTTNVATWMDHYPFGGNEYFLPSVDEQQYWNSSQPGHVSSTAFQPFSVAGNVLTIKAESVTASGVSNPASQPWNSGTIVSASELYGTPVPGLYSFKNGYFEINAQVPAGGPTNLGGPGFWSLMVLYPSLGSGGEIDGFEVLGGSPTTIRQTVHNGDGSNAISIAPTVATANSAFHRYGVDWQASTITFYIDGVPTGSVATPTGGSSNYAQPYYMQIGLAVAGSTSWGGGTPVNTQLVDPGFMKISSVGVWSNYAAAYGESLAGTTVPPSTNINASPTPGSAGSGNILSIVGGVIYLNGSSLGGANVTELYYTGAAPGANGATSHTAYQMNNAGNWYGPITASSTGTQVSTPVPSSVSNGVSDLSNTGAHPVTGFPTNKIAYSIQNYPTNVTTATPDSGATAITIWNTYFGYLVINNTAPVVNLNTGCSCDGSNSNLADDQAWGSTWDSYANGTAANGPTFPPPKQSMSNSWWFWGNAAANPDGTLNANGTINASQLTYWAPLLMPLVLAGKQPMFMVLQ